MLHLCSTEKINYFIKHLTVSACVLNILHTLIPVCLHLELLPLPPTTDQREQIKCGQTVAKLIYHVREGGEVLYHGHNFLNLSEDHVSNVIGLLGPIDYLGEHCSGLLIKDKIEDEIICEQS